MALPYAGEGFGQMRIPHNANSRPLARRNERRLVGLKGNNLEDFL
jgi:hypothetical protein